MIFHSHNIKCPNCGSFTIERWKMIPLLIPFLTTGKCSKCKNLFTISMKYRDNCLGILILTLAISSGIAFNTGKNSSYLIFYLAVFLVIFNTYKSEKPVKLEKQSNIINFTTIFTMIFILIGIGWLIYIALL